MGKLAIRRGMCCAAGVLSGFGATSALAQESLMIQPVLPDDFDRGRNISVVDRPRPDYDPLGINVGSFIVRPRVQADLGYTDNVFLTENNRAKDGYAALSPFVSASSDWSRHQVSARVGATFRRYFDETDRDENSYNLGLLGRFDVNPSIALTGEAQHSRLYESPLNGETDSPIAALSKYDRSFFGARAEYRAGQGRATLSVDHTVFNFKDIDFGNNIVVDQTDRDRDVTRLTGQVEYAFTPSLSVYGQGSYEETDYQRALLNSLDPNRDSNAFRIIAGFNFDLAGLARGTVGAGYVRRDFKSGFYKTISGPSIEAKLELFVTELTTVTFQARRIIADAAISNTAGFFDNRGSVRVDHELLRNLILNLQGEVAYIDYFDNPLDTTLYRVAGGGRYLINRSFSLEANLGYSNRSSEAAVLGSEFRELRGQISLIFQR